MCEIIYSVIGPSLDKKFGIVAIDHGTSHSAAAMSFLCSEDAERFTASLNGKQMPIPEFCDAFIEGRLAEVVF